jgi:hypothetical protein
VKQYRIYIVLVVLAVVLLGYLQSQTPKPINWEPTYSRQDKIPYGGYVLHDLLPKIFDGADVTTIQEPAYNALTAEDYAGRRMTYMFINGRLEFDEYDTEQLLRFAELGNTVFIAAEDISGPLGDSLHLEMEPRWGYEKDSVGINFSNPKLRRRGNFMFAHTHAWKYFTSIDTARTTILGTNQHGEANYISIRYGDGRLLINLVPDAFTNYALVNPSVQQYAITAISYLPVQEIYWDEYYKVGRQGAQTPLRFILSAGPLRWAYFLMIATVVLYVAFEIRRRQRIIPQIPPVTNTTLEFVDTVGRLYHQHGDHRNIAEKKIAYLLEYIRSNFNERTREIDEALYQRIAERSGIAQERITELFGEIRMTLESSAITEERLIRLNTLIENFYRESKR